MPPSLRAILSMASMRLADSDCKACSRWLCADRRPRSLTPRHRSIWRFASRAVARGAVIDAKRFVSQTIHFIEPVAKPDVDAVLDGESLAVADVGQRVRRRGAFRGRLICPIVSAWRRGAVLIILISADNAEFDLRARWRIELGSTSQGAIDRQHAVGVAAARVLFEPLRAHQSGPLKDSIDSH